MYLFSTSLTLAYDYTDHQPYSQLPPQGLAVEQVPLFVSIGFDDNGFSGIAGSGGTGGMAWILNYLRNKKNPVAMGNPLTYDSTPVRVSFFNTTMFQESFVSDDPVYVKRAWNTAMNDGHEIGNHTVNHLNGQDFTLAQWNAEIGDTITHLSKPFDPNEQPGSSNNTTGMGANHLDITGFRAPFLAYNDATFKAIVQQGLTYDTSIGEGWDGAIDGTNYPWPYTLDSGSIGNQYMVDMGFPNISPIEPYPGVWELGVTPVIIPPDDVTSQYGINYSIRDKVKANVSWFSLESGKITSFDYNLWGSAKLNKAETLATLKYTLDLRLQNGNRAPFMFGAHTAYFNSKNAAIFGQISVRERQEVIEQFIEYARSKPEVRIVPYDSIIDWMRNPSTIDCGDNCLPEPWDVIDAIGTRLNDLKNESDSLADNNFIGATDSIRKENQYFISAFLFNSSIASWNGRPAYAIFNLNILLRDLDQKMVSGSLRTALRQGILQEKIKLVELVGRFI